MEKGEVKSEAESAKRTAEQYNLRASAESSSQPRPQTVFAPGLPTTRESREFFNVVHILAVHGWNFRDSSAVEVSTRFSDQARDSIRQMLDERGMQGTTLKTTPLSGCGPLPGDLENRQTVGDRVLGCIEELKASGTMDELRKADVVFVIGHSQGAVVSLVLLGSLIEAGALTPQIPGVQRVCLLSMAGVYHGTHDKIAANFWPSMWREASVELREMRDPASEVFKTFFLPAIFDVLKNGVIVVPVCSYNDRVVNLCSATMDGVEHPNILRACFVHPRYSKEAGDEWTDKLLNKKDLLLSLWILAIHARNEGLFLDLARFCTNCQFADQASSALTSAGKLALESLWDMPSTRSEGSGLLFNTLTSAASFAFTFGHKVSQNQELVGNTKRLARDYDAHSVIYEDADVYRFAFKSLLERFDYFEQNSKKDEASGKYSLSPPTLRPSFNKEAVTEEDWAILHKSLDTIKEKGSDQLKQRLSDIENALRTTDPRESLSEADVILQKELATRLQRNLIQK